MTIAYIAYSTATASPSTFAQHSDEPLDVLVSVLALRHFLKHRRHYNVRRWMLDSGAFSVAAIGKKIRNVDYIAQAREVVGDAHEIVGLDVIGDGESTRRNVEAAWAAGVPAIPTIHFGENPAECGWMMMAPKIALGGMVAVRNRKALVQWIRHVMTRCWPKRAHAFGQLNATVLLAAPFHSADSSGWLYGLRRAQWKSIGPEPWSVRGGARDCWPEVRRLQACGAEAADRWKVELAALDGMGYSWDHLTHGKSNLHTGRGAAERGT